MSLKEEASFVLRYDGPALANNRMDIRNLAPALSGLADMVEEADSVFNKGVTSVTTLVGPFQNGCFEFNFSVLQEWKQQIIEGVTPIWAVMNSLGFKPKDGLMWLLMKCRGRKMKEVKKKGKGSNEVTLEDGEVIQDVPDDLIAMSQNKKIRNGIEKVVSDTLSNPGITNLYIINSNIGKLEYNIGKTEKDFFLAPLDPPTIEKVYDEKTLRIVSPVFGENYMWRLAEGKEVHFYSIQDEGFRKDVEGRRIEFAAGDSLRVRVCTTTETVEGKESRKYEIVKLLEVIKPPPPPLRQKTI